MPKPTNQNASGEGGVSIASWRAGATKQSSQTKSSTDAAVLHSKSTKTAAQLRKALALLRIKQQTTIELRANGLLQCAVRIKELRELGYEIATTRITAVDSFGFTHIGVARYALIKEAPAHLGFGVGGCNA